MSQESIQQELLQFLARNGRVEGSVNAGTELLESGILDSLLIVDLLGFVEQRLGVALQGADVRPANLRTVARLAAVIDERRRQSADA